MLAVPEEAGKRTKSLNSSALLAWSCSANEAGTPGAPAAITAASLEQADQTSSSGIISSPRAQKLGSQSSFALTLFGCSRVQKSKREERNLTRESSRPQKFSSSKDIVGTLPNTAGTLPRCSTKAKFKPDQGLQTHMCGLQPPTSQAPFPSICQDPCSEVSTKECGYLS